MFPTSVIAGMGNFLPATMFEVSEDEREELKDAVKVEF